MVLGSVSILLGSVSILIGKFLLVWDLRGWRRPAEDYPSVQGVASETGQDRRQRLSAADVLQRECPLSSGELLVLLARRHQRATGRRRGGVG